MIAHRIGTSLECMNARVFVIVRGLTEVRWPASWQSRSVTAGRVRLENENVTLAGPTDRRSRMRRRAAEELVTRAERFYWDVSSNEIIWKLKK